MEKVANGFQRLWAMIRSNSLETDRSDRMSSGEWGRLDISRSRLMGNVLIVKDPVGNEGIMGEVDPVSLGQGVV